MKNEIIVIYTFQIRKIRMGEGVGLIHTAIKTIHTGEILLLLS